MGWGRNEEKALKFDQLIDHIREVANRNCWPDGPEFMVYEYCGGNIDDAYNGGVDAGEVVFARRLLKLIEGE